MTRNICAILPSIAVAASCSSGLAPEELLARGMDIVLFAGPDNSRVSLSMSFNLASLDSGDCLVPGDEVTFMWGQVPATVTRPGGDRSGCDLIMGCHRRCEDWIWETGDIQDAAGVKDLSYSWRDRTRVKAATLQDGYLMGRRITLDRERYFAGEQVCGTWSNSFDDVMLYSLRGETTWSEIDVGKLRNNGGRLCFDIPAGALPDQYRLTIQRVVANPLPENSVHVGEVRMVLMNPDALFWIE